MSQRPRGSVIFSEPMRLDKRSSLDSLQQALFFSVLTGKRPAVVIYDTDGQEGQFECRVRTACQKAGVRYEVFR